MYQSENQKKYLKKIKVEKKLILFIQLSIVIIFLFLWEFLTRKNIIDSFIYSSPLNIIKTLKNLYFKNQLFSHILTTFKEILIVFSLNLILSFIIAILFYEYKIIEKIFDPFLTILNSLPKVALGPIIIIIFGANEKSIIIMALLINLIVSITTIYNGFENTDKSKIKMFNTFNSSKKDILLKLVIPSSYSDIITSMKLSISLTLIGVITGEFLVSKKGIGYLIIYGTQIFDLNLVFCGITILLILSYLLYLIIINIEKKTNKKAS